MSRLLFGFLTSIFGLNSEAQPYLDSWKNDPVESVVGVHLLSDFGSDHRLLSTEITIEIISDELHKLDWSNRFYQFIVVTKPGFSMEVGGSLNGVDGLSAMFSDRENRTNAVINQPPESVEQMLGILEQFILGNGSWQQMYEFEFTSY